MSLRKMYILLLEVFCSNTYMLLVVYGVQFSYVLICAHAGSVNDWQKSAEISDWISEFIFFSLQFC